MSIYTTEVRYICETANGQNNSSGGSSVNEILNNVWDKVIPQDWPIFDEEYRSVLCKKILKHYYTREIGLETVGLWRLKLETRLGEIMPFYNELYKTAIKEFDPFKDVDYYRNHSGENAGETNEKGNNNVERNTESERNTTSENTDSSNRWDVYSDTPQGALTNVRDEKYLTDARKIESGGSSESTGKAVESVANSETGNHERNTTYNNTNDYLEHVYGKTNNVSYMKLIKELRETIINIDMMVIDDLKNLFMLLWA